MHADIIEDFSNVCFCVKWLKVLLTLVYFEAWFTLPLARDMWLLGYR